MRKKDVKIGQTVRIARRSCPRGSVWVDNMNKYIGVTGVVEYIGTFGVELEGVDYSWPWTSLELIETDVEPEVDMNARTLTYYRDDNPGKKFDTGKAPIVQGCFQYFPKALLAVADVSAYGANKYDVPYHDKNWARLDDAFNRYTDGLGRHLVGEYIDGPNDPESNKLHAAHVAWNALARLEILINNTETES